MPPLATLSISDAVCGMYAVLPLIKWHALGPLRPHGASPLNVAESNNSLSPDFIRRSY